MYGQPLNIIVESFLNFLLIGLRAGGTYDQSQDLSRKLLYFIKSLTLDSTRVGQQNVEPLPETVHNTTHTALKLGLNYLIL